MSFLYNLNSGGEKDKDACIGDHGSALVCENPSKSGQYYQVGFLVHDVACGAQDAPSLFASFSFYRLWIEEKLARLDISV